MKKFVHFVEANWNYKTEQWCMIEIGFITNAGHHMKKWRNWFVTRVIVVDDDRDTVEVFTEYLAIKGIDVVAKGYNGKEAVELYKEHTPDITLLDVMMPEHDGFYGLEHIRNINPNAKVIMITADLTSDTEKKLRELQATGILYKPYEIDSVVETIEKVSKGEITLESLSSA